MHAAIMVVNVANLTWCSWSETRVVPNDMVYRLPRFQELQAACVGFYYKDRTRPERSLPYLSRSSSRCNVVLGGSCSQILHTLGCLHPRCNDSRGLQIYTGYHAVYVLFVKHLCKGGVVHRLVSLSQTPLFKRVRSNRTKLQLPQLLLTHPEGGLAWSGPSLDFAPLFLRPEASRAAMRGGGRPLPFPMSNSIMSPMAPVYHRNNHVSMDTYATFMNVQDPEVY